jgi:membrane-associated phospholipid phosphatase
MILLSHGGAWAWVGLGVLLAIIFRRTGVFAGAYQSSMAVGFATLLAGIQKSASFPSTHAAASFAGAYALSKLFPEIRIPIWLLAWLVAYSRVYVGVHYPLDVIGGAVVGLAAASFVVDGTRWYSDQLAARHFPRPDMAR